MAVWDTIAALGGAYAGYKSAKDEKAATDAQNALLKSEYEWEKEKQAPIVAGAKDALSGGFYYDSAGNRISQADYDALDDTAKSGYTFASQFQPFTEAAGQTATGGLNVAKQYLGATPEYQQAGLQGLGGLRQLYQTTPEQTAQLSSFFADPYAESVYRLAADDINRQADRAAKEASIDQGRFGALSSQKARQQAQLEGERLRKINELAASTGQNAYQFGAQQGQNYLAQQANLANLLYGAGQQGLSQATSAYNLGSQASNLGVSAPFTPFKQYASTISGTNVSAPTLGTAPSPVAAGIGTGLQTYNLFNPTTPVGSATR